MGLPFDDYVGLHQINGKDQEVQGRPLVPNSTDSMNCSKLSYTYAKCCCWNLMGPWFLLIALFGRNLVLNYISVQPYANWREPNADSSESCQVFRRAVFQPPLANLSFLLIC